MNVPNGLFSNELLPTGAINSFKTDNSQYIMMKKNINEHPQKKLQVLSFII